MTKEQMEACDIPTQEVLADIQDTEREIRDKSDELAVLMRNPTENKVRIYMLEGGISARRAFVEKLNALLKHREAKLPNDKLSDSRPL